MPTVTFMPSYRKAEVERGSTMLDAAQKAGLTINVVCGGQGKCGKCVMYVLSGKTQFDRQKYSRFFTPAELAKGACLACETTIEGDVQVAIPELTLIQEQKILVQGQETGIDFLPSVRKYYVELHPPSLSDPLSIRRAMPSTITSTRDARRQSICDSIPASCAASRTAAISGLPCSYGSESDSR